MAVWLVLAGLPLLPTQSACSLGADACLRMTDCERGFKCVEGVCETNDSLVSAGGDGGATDAAASDQ